MKLRILSLLAALAVPAFGNSYSTNFPLIENPISEKGKWINGGTVGLDWCNVQTLNNHSTGTQVGNLGGVYNDSTAVLTGSWGPDQTVQGIVLGGSTYSNAVEEVELRVRTTIKAHSITGYELDLRDYPNGGYANIVRWNGPLNSFTQIGQANNNYHGIKTGDTVMGTVVGDVISIYVNGILVAQATDSTYSSGSPGIGFWLSNGIGSDYGWSYFSATDTPTSHGHGKR
jgi:hypothetical protein